VLAYNQGPRAANRILRSIAEAGKLDVTDLNLDELMEVYSQELVADAIGSQPGMRPTELYRHFVSVMSCAMSRTRSN
jgi:hypothetical protein